MAEREICLALAVRARARAAGGARSVRVGDEDLDQAAGAGAAAMTAVGVADAITGKFSCSIRPGVDVARIVGVHLEERIEIDPEPIVSVDRVLRDCVPRRCPDR